MGATLNALGQRHWLVWLACIVWATLWAILPDSYQFLAWPVVAFVAVVSALVAFDHLYRYAPLQRALKLSPDGHLPVARDQPFRYLMLLSGTLCVFYLVAAWGFDFRPPIVVPIVASILLPGLLIRRREEEAFLASLRSDR